MTLTKKKKTARQVWTLTDSHLPTPLSFWNKYIICERIHSSLFIGSTCLTHHLEHLSCIAPVIALPNTFTQTSIQCSFNIVMDSNGNWTHIEFYPCTNSMDDKVVNRLEHLTAKSTYCYCPTRFHLILNVIRVPK